MVRAMGISSTGERETQPLLQRDVNRHEKDRFGLPVQWTLLSESADERKARISAAELLAKRSRPLLCILGMPRRDVFLLKFPKSRQRASKPSWTLLSTSLYGQNGGA
jgi:hypothetical protein